MAEKVNSTRPSSIRELLETSFNAHRREISDYASGHLNPTRIKSTTKKVLTGRTLLRCDGFVSAFFHSAVLDQYIGESASKIIAAKQKRRRSFWKSSALRDLGNDDEDSSVDQDRYDSMKNALLDFSSGTSAAIPLLGNSAPLPRLIFPGKYGESKIDTNLEKTLMDEMENLIRERAQSYYSVTSSNVHLPADASQYSFDKKTLPEAKLPSSKVYTEELKLPEIMLPCTSDPVLIPPSVRRGDEDFPKKTERQKFVTTHLAGVTRKDQFQKMLDFKTSVIKYSDTLEQNVLDGHLAVEHLEHKLVDRLLELRSQEPVIGPSFERLQLYAEIWNDLTVDSSIFGEVLREIKREYDNYLAQLLDEIKSTDRVELARCLHLVEEMSDDKKVSKADDLRIEVEDYEAMCAQSLIRNYELRREIEEEEARIEEERRLQQEEEEENVRRLLPTRCSLPTSPSKLFRIDTGPSKKAMSTEKRLKKLRVEIWERLDQLAAEKKTLKEFFVPKPVLRNLQHSLKDAEIEMQKLSQQNDFLAQIRTDCQTELELLFMRNGVANDTAQMVWNEIAVESDDSNTSHWRSEFFQKMLGDDSSD